MHKIQILFGDIALEADLNDSPTSIKLWQSLPVDGRVNVWGDEIYFEIPVADEQAPDAREEMEVGELGYWPPGRAFCIFFGPTPVSTGEKPRAASPVNVLGKVTGDVRQLKNVRGGTEARIEPAINHPFVLKNP